jgi:hypothetical protein
MEPQVPQELALRAQQVQQVLVLQEPLVLQVLMAQLEQLALKVQQALSASALALPEPRAPLA